MTITTNSWMSIARHLLGAREISGATDNPLIVEMFRLSGHKGVKDDETPWCAAFVGACLALSGFSGTKRLNARSYLTFGQRLAQPRPGCIVVLWRGAPNASTGHVGFFDHISNGRIYLLGGNQGDAVSIQGYPEERLLGYRWPVDTAPIAESELIPNILALTGTTGGSPILGTPMPVADEDDAVRGCFGIELGDDGADPTGIRSPWDLFTNGTLRVGESGKHVTDLQKLLVAKGYPLGPIDGKFGPLTEAAVFEFQNANEIPGSGIADAATLMKLLGGNGPELSTERQATREEQLLSTGSKIISYARQGKWGAAILTGIAGFGITDVLFGASKGVGNAITNATNATTGTAEPASVLAKLVPTLVGTQGGLWGLLLGGGILAWRHFGSAAQRRLDDHRQGLNQRH
jgi:uncharacterized protein (TIGR02594 family)